MVFSVTEQKNVIEHLGAKKNTGHFDKNGAGSINQQRGHLQYSIILLPRPECG